MLLEEPQYPLPDGGTQVDSGGLICC